jgi:hypothetical protein
MRVVVLKISIYYCLEKRVLGFWVRVWDFWLAESG